MLFARHYAEEIDCSVLLQRLKAVKAEKFTAGLFEIGGTYLGFDKEAELFLPCFGNLRTDTEALLSDILGAGVYGSATMSRRHSAGMTLAAVQGKKNSALRRLFPPLRNIDNRFSYARRFPVLLPVAWVHRMFMYSNEVSKKQDNTPESLLDYLRTGGFPAYVESGNRQILAELFNDIIYRDIVVRYRLANTAPVKQLSGYLLSHVGARLSPSRLKDAIHVQSAKTVLEYFDHLTECCMICRLEQFAESPKARMLAPKKVYACDTALASLFEHGENQNLGHKLENLVFWHLKKSARDMTYYHDGKGRECDFVSENNDGGFSLVQVCHELTDDNAEREFAGLAAAAKRFGLASGTVVTHRQSDMAVFDGCEISVVPATEYLVADE
jgi:hypothetical protein